MRNRGWVLGGLVLSLLLAPGIGAKTVVVKGPKGGRLMQAGKHKVEFHLDKDRKAHLYLYDAALKPVPSDQASISLKVLKGGTKAVELVKATGVPAHLVGKSAMPSPDGYLVSLSVKVPGKPVTVLKFNLIEEICGGCNNPEYVCTCGH